MRQVSPLGRIPLAALIFLLAIGVFRAAPSVAQSGQPTGETPKTLTATVRDVDTGAHTLKVVTGVGHALRIVKLQLSTECEIKVTGAQAQLADLKPGDIVRIRYRETDEADVAESIETVKPEGNGGEP
jgi:hypothetical protein